MKKIILFFVVVLFSLNSFGRLRIAPPDNYRIIDSLFYPDDSVTLVRYLVEFDGKMRVCVINTSCNCVITRRAAIAAFGFTSYDYVKPKELEFVYSLLKVN